MDYSIGLAFAVEIYQIQNGYCICIWHTLNIHGIRGCDSPGHGTTLNPSGRLFSLTFNLCTVSVWIGGGGLTPLWLCLAIAVVLILFISRSNRTRTNRFELFAKHVYNLFFGVCWCKAFCSCVQNVRITHTKSPNKIQTNRLVSSIDWSDCIHGFYLRFVALSHWPYHESMHHGFAHIYSWSPYGNASNHGFRASFCTAYGVIRSVQDVGHHLNSLLPTGFVVLDSIRLRCATNWVWTRTRSNCFEGVLIFFGSISGPFESWR